MGGVTMDGLTLMNERTKEAGDITKITLRLAKLYPNVYFALLIGLTPSTSNMLRFRIISSFAIKTLYWLDARQKDYAYVN